MMRTPAEETENDAPSEDATIPDQLSFYDFLMSEPAQKKQKSSSDQQWHYDPDADDPVNTPPEDEGDDQFPSDWQDGAN